MGKKIFYNKNSLFIMLEECDKLFEQFIKSKSFNKCLNIPVDKIFIVFPILTDYTIYSILDYYIKNIHKK
jgi:hypothetical protein